ncbi:hypothetical protein [uncultured Anaerococcus sp.]|uniref:hypothetical protein n=1 Tax=uncultured Anaerococcus sp. TaxID=293428 RepID=UPI00288A832B|nr:hypothetical protein [uncultured Anaerococcus sp.]
MNSKSLILALALGFVITGCKDASLPESKVSEETIAKALDGKVDLEKENEKVDEDKKEEESQDEEGKDSKFAITGDNLKKLMINVGEFDPSLARKLDDEDLVKLYKKCEKMSQRTGYWDVKDFFFQELAYDHPDKSLKFPLKSVESKYYWKKSPADLIGDKFEWERKLMVENGVSYDKVWAFTDKEIEDAFHEAYEKDPLALYDDYVKMATKILTGSTDENESENKGEETGAAKPEDYKNLIKFGSNERDYEALKDAMVNHYEFKKEIVDKIPNKDIDLANTRAQKRLEETGFGDIGLVFDELGKLYPGASTLYTGKN